MTETDYNKADHSRKHTAAEHELQNQKAAMLAIEA